MPPCPHLSSKIVGDTSSKHYLRADLHVYMGLLGLHFQLHVWILTFVFGLSLCTQSHLHIPTSNNFCGVLQYSSTVKQIIKTRDTLECRFLAQRPSAPPLFPPTSSYPTNVHARACLAPGTRGASYDLTTVCTSQFAS